MLYNTILVYYTILTIVYYTIKSANNGYIAKFFHSHFLHEVMNCIAKHWYEYLYSPSVNPPRSNSYSPLHIELSRCVYDTAPTQHSEQQRHAFKQETLSSHRIPISNSDIKTTLNTTSCLDFNHRTSSCSNKSRT